MSMPLGNNRFYYLFCSIMSFGLCVAYGRTRPSWNRKGFSELVLHMFMSGEGILPLE